jgi:hypothetical protein
MFNHVNDPQDVPKILGPQESIEYVQTRIDKIDAKRKHALEIIDRRKNEIVTKSMEQKCTLDTIEASQRTIQRVETIAVIGAACLLLFTIAKEGIGLVRWLWKRQKSEAQLTKLKDANDARSTNRKESGRPAISQRDRMSQFSKRMHARDWQKNNFSDARFGDWREFQ